MPANNLFGKIFSQHVVHRNRRLVTARLAHDLGRNARNRLAGRNLMQNDRPGRDTAAISEVITKSLSRTIADSLSVVDVLVISTSRSLSDSLSLSESINVQLVVGATASSVVNASALNTFALNT